MLTELHRVVIKPPGLWILLTPAFRSIVLPNREKWTRKTVLVLLLLLGLFGSLHDLLCVEQAGKVTSEL